MNPEVYPFAVRPLPYEYDALMPLLDEETMRFHHDRHYKAHVDHLNEALSDYPELQKRSLRELLTKPEKLPAAVRAAVRNHGGGVLSHELYFDTMKSNCGQEPLGALAEAIRRDFGSYKQWREQMQQAGVSLFGSGWVWLAADGEGRLFVLTTTNQDLPDLQLYTPLLALDVWEHAYYLQYQSRRKDYAEGWFDLINWRKACKRYETIWDNVGELQEHSQNNFK